MAEDSQSGSFLSWIPVIGPFVDTIAKFFSNRKTNATNLQIARETNQANRELAEYQAQFNERMWHQQNEYNSPSAQLERYAQAGLNPNLVYGQGTPGNAGDYPKYERPQMIAAHMQPFTGWNLGLSNIFENAFKYRNAKLDLERKETENRKADAEKAILDYQVIGASLNNTLLTEKGNLTKWQRKLLENTFQYQVDSAKASLQNLESRNRLLGQSYDLRGQEMSLKWRQMDLADKKFILQQAVSEASLDMSEAQRQKVMREAYRLEIEGLQRYDDLKFWRDFLGSSAKAKTALSLVKSLIAIMGKKP